MFVARLAILCFCVEMSVLLSAGHVQRQAHVIWSYIRPGRLLHEVSSPNWNSKGAAFYFPRDIPLVKMQAGLT
jgi:hypothetical protein